MPDMDEFDVAFTVERVDHRIQCISHDAVTTLDAGATFPAMNTPSELAVIKGAEPISNQARVASNKNQLRRCV